MAYAVDVAGDQLAVEIQHAEHAVCSGLFILLLMRFSEWDGDDRPQIMRDDALPRGHLANLQRVRDHEFRCRVRGIRQDGVRDGRVTGKAFAL